MNEVTRLQPRQRIIVACDVEESSSRTNPAKAALRLDMYELLEATLKACDIREEVWAPFHDRGDGAMLLLRPDDEVPKTLLLHTFVPTMTERLAEHSATYPGRMFRLRLAIHSGEVHFDTRGVFGADIDLTFRLLNSRDLKRRLRETDAPLVLAVSNYIHQSVIRHGYDGIDGRTFEPAICLQVADQRHVGWVQVPSAPSADLYSA
jgi:hypothetical protein